MVSEKDRDYARAWAREQYRIPYVMERYTLEDLEKIPLQLRFTHNGLFRYTFIQNNALLIHLVSALTGRNVIKVEVQNSEPAVSLLEKNLRYDLICTWVDEHGHQAVMCLEITNYGTEELNLKRIQDYGAQMRLDYRTAKNGEQIDEYFQVLICGKLNTIQFPDVCNICSMYVRNHLNSGPVGDTTLILVSLGRTDLLPEEKPLDEWTEIEQISYWLYHSTEKENATIKLLKQKEVFRRMDEAKQKYLDTLAVHIAELKAFYDELALKEELEGFENAKQATKEAERRTAEAERKNAELEQRTAELEQRAAEAEQKTAEAEQKTAEAEQKTAEAERKTAEAERKTAEAERKAAEAKQKAEEAEQSTARWEIAFKAMKLKLSGKTDAEIAAELKIPEEQVSVILQQE